MSCFVDLHLHSNVDGSDGTMRPDELINYVLAYARQNGIGDESITISLTDHNTICGLVDAANRAKELGIRFICGCEIMIYDADDDIQAEILAYGDYEKLKLPEFKSVIFQASEAVKRKIIKHIELWHNQGLNIEGINVSLPEKDSF